MVTFAQGQTCDGYQIKSSQIIFIHSKSFDMRGYRKYMTSVQDGIKQQRKYQQLQKKHIHVDTICIVNRGGVSKPQHFKIMVLRVGGQIDR